MNEWINEWKQVKWKQTCIINIQFCFHTFYSGTNFKSNFNSFERRKECLGKNILVCIDNMTIKANNLKKSNIKGAVSRNSAKLGNYKMPVKLRET